MPSITNKRNLVKAIAFGVRGCTASCTCDPCDCNPCNCGDDRVPHYPEWRLSGYQVSATISEVAHLSGQIILALSQPVEEGNYLRWREVILVDESATNAQIADLLDLFEERLESLPAEVEDHPLLLRAVHRATISYQEGHLTVNFSPNQATIHREGENPADLSRAWAYAGPVASRGSF